MVGEKLYKIRKQNNKIVGPYSLRVIKAFLIAKKLLPEDQVILSQKNMALLEMKELDDFWQDRRKKISHQAEKSSRSSGRKHTTTIGSMDMVPTKPTMNPFKMSRSFIKGGQVVFFRGKVLPPGPNPTYAGSLFKNSILKMLYRLFIAKKTGRFHFRLARHIVDLFLEDGVPVYAVSNRNETRLGTILVHQGLLSERELKSALKQATKDNKPLGQILLRERYSSAVEIKLAFYEQLKERIYEVFKWKTAGVYRFYENQVTGCDFPIEAEPYLIMRDGILEHMPINIIEEQLAGYRFNRVARLIHPMLSIDHFQPSGIMREFYFSISNQDSFLDITGDAVEQGLFEEEEILRIIYLLWQTDLLRMGEEMIGERTQQRIRELKQYHKKLQLQTRMQRLGLKGGASPDDIRNAYLKLAKKFHPDQLPVGTHPEVEKHAEEVFALISEAYHILY